MLFIINKNACLSKSYRIFKSEIEPLLKEKKVSFEYVVTETVSETVNVAGASVKKHKEIIACGGDGTVNAVGTGILNATVRGQDRPTMGTLPIGSSNNFALQTLKIPSHPQEALRVLLEGKKTVIDAGKMGEHFFFNVFGIGIGGEVAHIGQHQWPFCRLPSIWLRYKLPALLIAFRGISSFDVEVRTDRGDNFIGTLIFANTYNGKGEGKYFPLNENGSASDGVLNMVLIENISLAKYVVPPSFPVGLRKLKEDGKIHFFPASKIQVKIKNSSRGEFPFAYIDGDLLKLEKNTFTIEVLPKALSIISG